VALLAARYLPRRSSYATSPK